MLTFSKLSRFLFGCFVQALLVSPNHSEMLGMGVTKARTKTEIMRLPLPALCNFSFIFFLQKELAHKLSRSFDMKEDQELLESSGNMRRHRSMQRLSRADITDPQGDDDGLMVSTPAFFLSVMLFR